MKTKLTRILKPLLPGLIGWMLAMPLCAQDVQPSPPPAWRLDTTSSEQYSLSWATEPGKSYDLWESTDLSEWSRVDGFPQKADGTQMAHAFAPVAEGRLFFRIEPVSDTPAPEGFALIPGGPFQMGDATGDGWRSGSNRDLPVHTVQVDGFYMAKNLVTKERWDEVREWGVVNGYIDLPEGISKGEKYPVGSVSWYDVVKWCNAASEKEGGSPCYKLGGEVYRTGESDGVICDWRTNGYRLPTEAEWEKAARGGLVGKNFPWGDTITHGQANYYSRSSYSYDVSSTRGHHPDYDKVGEPSPVGVFAANGYGLHDMAGNRVEWCWDWFSYSYYREAGSDVNPRGPASGVDRVTRGGGWADDAYNCRSAYHDGWFPDARGGRGFRPVRNLFLGAAVIEEHPYSQSVAPGDAITLKATVSDSNGLSYQWYRNGESLPGQTDGQLLLTDVDAGMAGDYFVRITAAEGGVLDSNVAVLTVSPMAGAPDGFALIPLGPFRMGDSTGVGKWEEPVHTVQVDAFYMAKNLVTKERWDEVRNWGLANGYLDLPAGNGSYATKGANHPVHSVSWYDMVKWCNAASEMEGLSPCYRLRGAVYRTGEDHAYVVCDWGVCGYRLPTEAEWEKAARGGLEGKQFPWGDAITHAQANYISSSDYPYDVSPTRGGHPDYVVGDRPYTSPVGAFPANGYGLHDMAGNLYEWCWDRYDEFYYAAAGADVNPRGPERAGESDRFPVQRGGSWSSGASGCRTAARATDRASYRFNFRGFRAARSFFPFGSIVIEEQPQSQPVATGESTTLKVTVADSSGMSYQWYRNGEALPGQTNNQLHLVVEDTGMAGDYFVRIRAADGGFLDSEVAVLTVNSMAGAPDGFALIPAGPFQMGDAKGMGYDADIPVHTVDVDMFYLAKNPVTKKWWDEVRNWALVNGYTDLPAGNGSYASKGSNHPVHSVSWYDVVKWCNAASEKEGLRPCYRLGANVYRSGTDSSVICDWSADGYRLPTEAEWEKAARGGLVGKNFPWGDTIGQAQANYFGNDTFFYEVNFAYGHHPAYFVAGETPYTSPVGAFPANGYGLRDMAGNLYEWCWDRYSSSYYSAAGSGVNPRGPVSGSSRVCRGGHWGGSALGCCVARRWSYSPDPGSSYVGFRPARSSAP